MQFGINDPVWPAINPGEFKHQVSLLVPTIKTDASGGVSTYAPSVPPVQAWVKIQYIRGDEIVKAGQDVSQVYVKLTGWYRSEFSAQTRVQLPSGIIVLVSYVENVGEMNTYMILTCLGIGSA
jgi:head-tail adaptor